ncbi:hypothetical protein WA026_013994 [Henosepilachna vigintioctopunctata]|uniref:RING finger protein 141 n=1 Tax=Henosepilachna vigintioctopunctata TaxID=420089 RepID=A0AAW1U9K4_9CUCU
MGQVNTSNYQDLLPNIFSDIFSKEPNTLIAKEIRELTHERFLSIIGELNALSRDSLDEGGNQMIFAVRKGSDTTILWKAVVEIACVKVDRDCKQPKSYRLLTLGELLKVFFTLKCQMTALNQSEAPQMHYDEFISNINDEPDLAVQCSICFERKHELTLPCAHSFCSQCLEEWNSENPSCPICRTKLDSTDDTWVLSEKPTTEDVSKELRINLLELSEERETSCVTS